MDITKEVTNVNPRDDANPLSILFFTYTIGIFKKGYSKTFNVEDLYNPLRNDRSKTLGDRLEAKWTKHLEQRKKKGKSPSLLRVLVQTFWPEYLYLGIILFFMDCCFRLVMPQMLGQLLDYFKEGSTKTQDEALMYAGIFIGLNGCYVLLINQYIMEAFHYGMRIRAACCAMVYRKALKLSKTALGETPPGKVVNLLSNDVSRFDIVSIFIHHMWVAPLTAIIVMYFLWIEAGYAGLIGMIPVFLVAPIQSYTGKLSSQFRRQTAYKTDERVRLMDEIISGVQVIKMYAWERAFGKLVSYARQMELKIVTKLSYVRGLFMTFNLFTTRVALFSALLALALTDVNQITATKVFVFMSYFGILSQTMSSMFVRGISEIAEALVSVKRLQAFMLNNEFEEIKSPTNNNSNIINEKMAVDIRKGTCKWNPNSSDYALSNLNISLERGTLLGIIGPVGSGKSSLLQAILGELVIVTGEIEINGTLSYASQEPWVFAATVRQNILFGLDFDKKRYNEVVRVCALEKDFDQFTEGDLTIVGERGASLSGGQKARINLARAVYRKADIYLLDDPLSAVDTHVAKQLYQECINGYLANKTRLLVTHQVHHLKDADTVVIMNNGSVEIQGTFNQLSMSDNTYAKLLLEEQEPVEEEKVKPDITKLIRRQISSRSRANSISSSRSELSIVDSLLQEEQEHEEANIKMNDMQEESSKGKVKGSLFFKYLLAGGNWCFVGNVLMLYVLAQLAASAVDYFVSYWVKVEEFKHIPIANSTQTDAPAQALTAVPSEFTTEMCLYIYGGLIIALFILAIVRSIMFYKLAMRSSQNLHDSMFTSVVSTNMRFFDINPSGRILNRFSKDIGFVDELLPKCILDAGQIMLSMVGSLLLVAIVNPIFLVPIVVIGVFFLFLRIVFLKSSLNIKRLEGMARSPVFTHLNASLQGLTTIRAYRAQDILTKEFDKHQDLHSSAWYMYIAASSAFGFILDLLCFLFIGIVTFSFLFLKDNWSGGDVGLAISQSAALTGMVQWGIRQSAEVANLLTSVERAMEYALLSPETQPAIPKKPAIDWPKHGKIAFQNMGLRYFEGGPLVLKNLNILIKPQEKVGIVGRTGAGKSSLITALFRLAVVEGEVEIDGTYTKDLDLQDLRSRISIIPQDPVLFSGTLRYNLDPFEEYEDEALYKALSEVELKDPANIINRLENRVLDGGSNYSVGQRQLICLARAIIRKNRILMLDEATANVDPQTDALIQKTIREKFANCTVLTVAHRLNTIMDSDRVLVMDSGTMVEFNHPHILLQNQKSVFYRMVAETGRSMMEQLKGIARYNFEQKHGVPE